MKRKRKQDAAPAGTAATRNPKLNAQMRTVLRTHYAAKYHTR